MKDRWAEIILFVMALLVGVAIGGALGLLLVDLLGWM